MHGAGAGTDETSWRTGIDTASTTQLVTDRLFAVSQNPVFLGMLLSLTGLWLAVPNMTILLFLLLGYVLMQL
jgi:protein-S-isoprenylcysteine O-methyltransferase Ste14